MKGTKKIVLASTIMAMFALASVPAMATDYYWNVATGDWNVAGNWTPTGPPADNAWAVIDNGGTATIDTDILLADVWQISAFDGIVNQSTYSV